MSKKDECFEIFYAHSEATREKAIELAMSKTRVSKATAWTYYPAWRKEFMSTPNYITLDKQMKEKLKNNTEKTAVIPKMANKITEVAEKSPIRANAISGVKAIVEKDEFKTLGIDAVKSESKEIKWKADVIKSVETEKDIFEITKLIPVVMLGKYGTYNFDKAGVKAMTHCEKLITRDGIEETLEALAIWERCYGGSNAEENLS